MAFGDDDDLPNEGVRIKRADDHPKQSIGSPDVVIAKTSLASIESLTMPLVCTLFLSLGWGVVGCLVILFRRRRADYRNGVNVCGTADAGGGSVS